MSTERRSGWPERDTTLHISGRNPNVFGEESVSHRVGRKASCEPTSIKVFMNGDLESGWPGKLGAALGPDSKSDLRSGQLRLNHWTISIQPVAIQFIADLSSIFLRQSDEAPFASDSWPTGLSVPNHPIGHVVPRYIPHEIRHTMNVKRRELVWQ